jgi:hypothetical protein
MNLTADFINRQVEELTSTLHYPWSWHLYLFVKFQWIFEEEHYAFLTFREKEFLHLMAQTYLSPVC